MADVEPANVSVAGPANVIGADIVRKHRPDRCRPHQKTILIIVRAGIIFVVVVAELRGVALGEKILDIQVGQHHLLMPV